MTQRTTTALFLMLVLAGGSPAGAGDLAATVPACPLLAPGEVAAAFGKPVEAAEQEPSGGGPGEGRMTACFWTPAGGTLGATVSLVVWTWPPGSGNAAGFLETIRAMAEAYPETPRPETLAIGDDAVWDGDRLHVRVGETGFTLSTSLNALDATPDAEAKLAALAVLAAGRL